jgi:large subunit ribosomal protein L15
MQLNNLIPKTKNKKKTIVGRGGHRGKTSGRGGKGQTARAGHKKRPELRDFIKRVPKLRGRGVNGLRTIETKPVVINLDILEKTFALGAEVSPKTLLENKVISTIDGNIPIVKILAGGEITKKINVSDCVVSISAKEKIEKAGGTVVVKVLIPVK